MGDKRVMFFGPSGTGKTTLAKEVAKEYGIPFLDASYSTLIPKTKEMPQVNMLEDEKGWESLEQRECQLLTLRGKLFRGHMEFVSDRSYLDNLVFYIFKLSKSMAPCAIDDIRNEVIRMLERDCTHLIFVPYTNRMLSSWVLEDNGKRITNQYFQWQLSQIYKGVLDYFYYRETFLSKLVNAKEGYIKPSNIYGHEKKKNEKKIKVLILDSESHGERMMRVKNFLAL